jgi:1-acyl-sn-glycerol-3-phosphate acyltransferase
MYTFLHIVINLLRRLGIWRWTIAGVENLPPREQGGMVLAVNHTHWIDIPAIGGCLPLRYRLSWLAKSELFKQPISGWWLRAMQVVPIKRGQRDLAALEAAVQRLTEGAVFLIFPEGHRSRNGVLLPGRNGAIRLAVRSGTPIVPVAISGSASGLKGSLRQHRLHIQIGQPYRVDLPPNAKIPADQMERLTTDMMIRIAAMLPAENRGPYAGALEEQQA